MTPLYRAKLYDNSTAFQLLLDRGADVTVRNKRRLAARDVGTENSLNEEYDESEEGKIIDPDDFDD